MQKKNIPYIIISVVVLIYGGWYLLSMNNHTEPVATKDEIAVDVSKETTNMNTDEEDNERNIKIYITGAVKSPGVYSFNERDRIDDAIKKANGSTKDADLEKINLAAFLEDGEQIHVPSVIDNSEEIETSIQDGIVNINTANETDLKTLPGIGDVLAKDIITYREEKGNFTSKEEIMNVNRIKDKTFDTIKDLISVQ